MPVFVGSNYSSHEVYDISLTVDICLRTFSFILFDVATCSIINSDWCVESALSDDSMAELERNVIINKRKHIVTCRAPPSSSVH